MGGKPERRAGSVVLAPVRVTLDPLDFVANDR
jgi:hypothetical protein